MLSARLQRTPPGFKALAIVWINGFSTSACAGPVIINVKEIQNGIEIQGIN